METLNQLKSNSSLDADEIQTILENFNLLFEKPTQNKKEIIKVYYR